MKELERPHIVTGWRHFLQTMVARAYPRVVGQLREKAWIFFETLLPFLAMVGYVYVYRAMKAPEEYIGFVVLGGAMTAFWLNMMWSMSSQMFWEKENGNLALYIMGPQSMPAIMLGMALGGLFATSLRALLILVLGTILFKVPFMLANFWQAVGVFLLTMTALYGLGMLFGSVFLLWGRDAQQVSLVMQEPIYFISGFYFPVRTFGPLVAMGASVLPLTLGLDAMRQLVFANGPTLGFLSVPIEIALLALLALLFVGGSAYAMRLIERKAIEEGTLTDRRK